MRNLQRKEPIPMSEYDLRAPIEAILMVISEPVTPEDLAAALGT